MTAPDREIDSPFETISDVEYTQWDRLKELSESNVVAPLRILLSDPRGVFGLGTVLFYVFMGTIGVMIVPKPKAGGPVLQMAFKSGAHPLGTDRYGKDLISLIVHATPAMLKMILSGAVFTIAAATIIGTLSGYKGGTVDEVLMMFTDAVLAVPGLPLIIVIAAILEPRSPFIVGLVIGLPRWAGLARALRSEVLSLREESFVEASRITGLSTPTILWRELIPNLMPYITINFVGAARGIIFGSVALYFLRILPITNLNWGVMMNNAYRSTGALYSWQTAHWLIFPMVAIVWLSFGLIMLGQAADRIFNPRLRAHHAHPEGSEE